MSNVHLCGLGIAVAVSGALVGELSLVARLGP